MSLRREATGLLPFLALSGLLAAGAVVPAGAQTTVFSEIHTIAAPTVAVPQEFTFSVDTAGTYTVTLTDLGAALTPSAPLAAVELGVTDGDTLVGTPLVGAGTLTLSALAAGSYELHVVGLPGNVPGSGPFGIQVSNAGNASIAAFQGTLALPSAALPNGESVLDDTFTVPTSGSYTVTLSDLQLPQSLSLLTLLLIAQGGSTPLATLPSNGSDQATVTLTAGVTYSIFAVGQANPAANAGLYSAVVAASGGAVAYGRAVPVGTTASLGTAGLAAGSASFALTDLKYPAALSQVGAVLTLTGQPVAQLAAAGAQPFTAVAGTYQAFAAGTAVTAAPEAGSYAVQVTQGGATALGVAEGVTAAGSALTPYSFNTTLSAAGTYSVDLNDFQFPAALASLGLAAVQGGAQLGTPLTAAGTLNISAASGPLTLLCFVQAAQAGGLFGVNVLPTAGGASIFSVTQGVGGVFIARQLSITQAGSYAVTAMDLGFPAPFATFDTIVTQGSTQLGSIFGGGTFTINAVPGEYFINFIAQPTGAYLSGTYALTVATAPAAPVVTLSTDNPQVASGSTVDIIWSSQNASSCTASGGWSGTQATSGFATSTALTATTTFTLSCTGPGGTTSKSVTVTITPSSGGGGGSMDIALMVMLGGLLLAARVRAARECGKAGGGR